MVIHKQTLEVTDQQVIQLPINAQILTVQTQYEQPCLWYLHGGGLRIEPVTIVMYGTGHPVPQILVGERTYI
jgi:hypothetical protein